MIDALRDAIGAIIKTGWDASIVTSSLSLQWDDVEGDKPGTDSKGRAIAFARVTIQNLPIANTETISGDGQGKDQRQGLVTVQCFGPRGQGHKNAYAIAKVVMPLLQRKRIIGYDAWFLPVSVTEIPSITSPWDQVNVVAPFTYLETVGA